MRGPWEIFEIWVSETPFPAFWGHFWAKYNGVKSHFFSVSSFLWNMSIHMRIDFQIAFHFNNWLFSLLHLSFWPTKQLRARGPPRRGAQDTCPFDHSVNLALPFTSYVTGFHFYKYFAFNKFTILDLPTVYIVQNELSSKFSVLNYPVTKNYPVSLFVKKTSSCQLKKNPVSAILWRHFFDWHVIGARIVHLLILCIEFNLLHVGSIFVQLASKKKFARVAHDHVTFFSQLCVAQKMFRVANENPTWRATMNGNEKRPQFPS